MSKSPLFALTHANGAFLVQPQRDMPELAYAEIECAEQKLLGQIAKDGSRKHVIVDFAKTKFFGSTALGLFVRIFKRVQERGGKMVLCHLSPEEHEMLHLTHLDRLWTIRETLNGALEAVGARLTIEEECKTWIVVADRSLARIFLQCPREDHFREVATMHHPQARAKMSDEVSDGAGYFRGGATDETLVAGERRDDFRHHTALDFARELAGFLDSAFHRGEFDRLHLIAAPLFLGALRDELPATLVRHVELEIAKDYTKTPLETIEVQVKSFAADTTPV